MTKHSKALFFCVDGEHMGGETLILRASLLVEGPQEKHAIVTAYANNTHTALGRNVFFHKVKADE